MGFRDGGDEPETGEFFVGLLKEDPLLLRQSVNYLVILLISTQIFYVTNSKKQSPSWADNRSVIQKILHRLWKPKVHCRIYKSPPLDSILKQVDPVHTLTSYLFKIHLSGSFF